jgi:arylsulfatase A-like enzyme
MLNRRPISSPARNALRRNPLLLALSCAYLTGCPRGADAPDRHAPSGADRPNVIFIFTDDQAPGTLGFEGNTHIRTPNIDRLAAEGVRFTRAYVPLPQCAPSRAAVLTGLYPHQNGVLTNEAARLRPDAFTFGDLFKSQGYATALVGKWHLGNEQTAQCGFTDMWVTFPMPGEHVDPPLWVNGQLKPHTGNITDVLTDYALQFVDAHQDDPFFLWVAYKAPHPPFVAYPGEHSAYDPEAIPLPESIRDDLSGKPASQQRGKCHEWFQQTPLQAVRRDRALYYSMISGIDHNVGRIIDRLRQLNLDRRTIVIFKSDNGILLGEHQMLRKGPAFYEELVRTPTVFWAPGRLPADKKVDDLIGTLDLLPTFCAILGVSPPRPLPGRDIWPLAAGTADVPHRDALFFEYLEKEATGENVPMRGLVTDRYKYSIYLSPGEEELYDLQSDPHEMTNLANSADHRDTLDALRARLADWRRETGDTP